MGGFPTRGSGTFSSAGGVGRDGSAVILLVDPAVVLEMLIDVGGRGPEMRLLELLEAAGFFITGKDSVPEMLAVDGLLIWLEGRENG